MDKSQTQVKLILSTLCKYWFLNQQFSVAKSVSSHVRVIDTGKGSSGLISVGLANSPIDKKQKVVPVIFAG